MARFNYKVKVTPAEIREGTIEAGDRQNAILRIIEQGCVPLEVKEVKPALARPRHRWDLSFFSPRKVRSGEVCHFLRQLHDLVDADIPLLRSLQLIGEQTKDLNFKKILELVKSRVQDGQSLSAAVLAQGETFPHYIEAMIRAGERSGQLKIILKRLCQLTEKHVEVMAKIRMSLAYPFMILAVGFLTVFVIMAFVVPRLAVMFDDLEQELPLVTQILVNGSHFLSRFWWLAASLLAGALFIFQGWRQTEAGKLSTDRFFLKIPYAGNFLKTQELERFARTSGILLESGVEVVSALECGLGVVSNEELKEDIRQVIQTVIQGGSLAKAFLQSPSFPPAIINMVAVSEESGRIGNGFLKWAESYERESDRYIKIATTLLEPIMILIIGSLVGFMVMALLLPIFRMNLIMN